MPKQSTPYVNDVKRIQLWKQATAKTAYLDDVEFDGLLLQEGNVHVLSVVPPLDITSYEYIVVLNNAATAKAYEEKRR